MPRIACDRNLISGQHTKSAAVVLEWRLPPPRARPCLRDPRQLAARGSSSRGTPCPASQPQPQPLFVTSAECFGRRPPPARIRLKPRASGRQVRPEVASGAAVGLRAVWFGPSRASCVPPEAATQAAANLAAACPPVRPGPRTSSAPWPGRCSRSHALPTGRPDPRRGAPCPAHKSGAPPGHEIPGRSGHPREDSLL